MSGRAGRSRWLWAEPGDHLVVRSRRRGVQPRHAEVLETMGPCGGPPLRVRWEDDGRIEVLHVGGDLILELHHRRHGAWSRPGRP